MSVAGRRALPRPDRTRFAVINGPAISVVIPTYERCDALVRTLDALARQTFPAEDFEAVVVVDGSRDDTRAVLETLETPFALSWIWQENRGRSAARNAGIQAAHADLVVFVDDDVEVTPGFLTALHRAHERAARRGVLAFVHCAIDASTPVFAGYWSRNWENLLEGLARTSSTLHWSKTYTMGFSARREELRAVGGFDESFDGYGVEDAELALRLSEAGLTLELCLDAVAYHHYDRTFEQAAAESESQGRSALIFAVRHPKAAADFGLHDLEPPSFARRFVRYVLPRMTLAVPQMSAMVTRLVTWMERRRSKHLDFAYTLSLEYRYLVGRLRASRDDGLISSLSQTEPID
jgi:GT2 family glycosyltransferase